MSGGLQYIGAFAEWCLKKFKVKYSELLTEENRTRQAYIGLFFLLIIVFIIGIIF